MREPADRPPPFDPPERFNISEYFLGDRIREGRGSRCALLAAEGQVTYAELDDLANRYGNLLREAGVRPEERILIALPDGPSFVAALFGALRIGAVGVMLNPFLRCEEIVGLFRYTRGAVLLTDSKRAPRFREAASRSDEGVSAAGAHGEGKMHCNAGVIRGEEDGTGRDSEVVRQARDRGKGGSRREAGGARPASGDCRRTDWGAGIRAPRDILVVDTTEFEERLRRSPAELQPFPAHRDDAAIWLFSGGTTGRPKGVVQTHASFANTTERYGKRVLQLSERDVTLSVPKLFFGYATGSNLFFPFSVGATATLFPDRCTPEVVFEKIEKFRPTVLVNVPSMVREMLRHPGAESRDLSSLRFATSAGEALSEGLCRQWRETFGSELLDGLGTAEMWHIFVSNRLGRARPGKLGTVVPGFEVRVRDDEGRDVPCGEAGWLWVRGKSRASGYWQQAEATARAFRGEWHVSGDMVACDEEGWFVYRGRGDDMLKVKGKWLAPAEIESCMLQHSAVADVAVVGVRNRHGLAETVAWVVPSIGAEPKRGAVATPADKSEDPPSDLKLALRDFVASRLASYKAPATIHLADALPRTHLGKIDRAALREAAVRRRPEAP